MAAPAAIPQRAKRGRQSTERPGAAPPRHALPSGLQEVPQGTAAGDQVTCAPGPPVPDALQPRAVPQQELTELTVASLGGLRKESRSEAGRALPWGGGQGTARTLREYSLDQDARGGRRRLLSAKGREPGPSWGAGQGADSAAHSLPSNHLGPGAREQNPQPAAAQTGPSRLQAWSGVVRSSQQRASDTPAGAGLPAGGSAVH